MTNTIVRNSFSAVVYRACNITHTIEKKPLLRFLSAQKTFFRWFYVICQCTKYFDKFHQFVFKILSGFQMSRNQMIQIFTDKKIKMNKTKKEIFIDRLTSSDIDILKAVGLFVYTCNIS